MTDNSALSSYIDGMSRHFAYGRVDIRRLEEWFHPGDSCPDVQSYNDWLYQRNADYYDAMGGPSELCMGHWREPGVVAGMLRSLRVSRGKLMLNFHSWDEEQRKLISKQRFEYDMYKVQSTELSHTLIVHHTDRITYELSFRVWNVNW